jgi:uncharacterized glyoxalase superfamily protein PhnB
MPTDQTGKVVPNIYVDSVETLRSFYIDRLGFDHMMGVVGKDGRLDVALVTRDGGIVMLTRPDQRSESTSEKPGGPRPIEVYFGIRDVDAYHDEVRTRGVTIREPLTTQWWGDRTFAVQDPYGYVLWFFQNVGEVVPPPGVKVI